MSEQTVLEQANAALAEARQVLQKSEENLSKSSQANDYSLSQNRKLAYALSSLLSTLKKPTPNFVDVDLKIGNQLNEIVNMANGSSITFLNNETRDIYDVIHAINVLAMSNTDVIQVSTAFCGSSNSFCVSAFDISTVWSDKESKKERLLDEHVFLNIEPNPLKKLLYIESQLTELIIEAREASEAKAEVGA